MDTSLAKLGERHMRGETGGMFAVCSAHPLVLQSALEMALAQGRSLLIEATANQVNPSGGYSGMTPSDFAGAVMQWAGTLGLSADRVILGADHLGPHVWKHEPAAAAMEKAAMLASQCVRAGFQKIHLDTVQGCADDPGPRLPLEETARRAAQLCLAAEAAAAGQPRHAAPLYVVGDEVPPPGGGLEEGHGVMVTDPGQLMETLDAYEHAFRHAGVASAWPRVVAVVVQPGVEFGDRRVAAYHPARAVALSAAHARLPGIMTYEIHATDYQTAHALQLMVRDHFALLKAGPCLTFALRETLYALSHLETAIGAIDNHSQLPQVMERLMNAHPAHWQSHYKGTPEALYHLRHYSYRDRIRYYWSCPEARKAVDRLMRNLSRPIPDALLSQFLPEAPCRRQPRGAPFDPADAIKAAIRKALQPYADACWV